MSLLWLTTIEVVIFFLGYLHTGCHDHFTNDCMNNADHCEQFDDCHHTLPV